MKVRQRFCLDLSNLVDISPTSCEIPRSSHDFRWPSLMPFDGSEPCVSFIPEVPQLEGCEALGLNGSCPHLADSGNILKDICTYYLWIYIIYIYMILLLFIYIVYIVFYAHVFQWLPLVSVTCL